VTAQAVQHEFLSLIRSESAATTLDLIELWPLLDPDDLDGSFSRYATGAQLAAAAHTPKVLAATDDFFADLREIADVPGAVPTGAGLVERALADLIQYLYLSGPAAIKTALSKGYTLERALELALVLSSGALQKWVIDAGRGRMMDLVRTDQTALGWARASASKKPCAWCRMLISRGAEFKYSADFAYRSEATAGFSAHRHCRCFAVPIWKMTDAQSAQAADYYDEYRGQDLNAIRRADYADPEQQHPKAR
jgi:hypothetical protein